jgi:hypothetical protein
LDVGAEWSISGVELGVVVARVYLDADDRWKASTGLKDGQLLRLRYSLMKAYEEGVRPGDSNNPTDKKDENSGRADCGNNSANDPLALANQFVRCHL